MKPTQEERWTLRHNNNGPTVYDERGDAVCMVYTPHGAKTLTKAEEAATARGKAIAAAPTLIRALQRLVDAEAAIERSNFGGEDLVAEARAALVLAGVAP